MGYLTRAFLGAQKRAEVLRNPCTLGGPQCQARGDTLYASPEPSWGPKRGQNCYGTPAFSVAANQKWTKSEVATSHLPSWGPKRGRKCYGTPAFSGIPQSKGDKIRIGYLTPTFLGAQKRAELLRNPCILGGPQRQAHGENQNGLPHPCLLGGPKEGGSAT